tara:strand:+ start:20 stop:463 length:444 start_codon:yes stop_codon:yes gene_type:complete
MNPQLNKVFSKLAKADKKTELASEKVELTVVGDITKAVKSMVAAEKSVETIESQAKKAEKKHEDGLIKAYEKSLDDQDALNDKLRKLQDVNKESKKALESANKAAKGLGLSAKEIPGYTQLEKLISEYPSKFNAVSDVVQKISKVTI